MKVQDVIKALQQYSPDTEVMVEYYETGYTPDFKIEEDVLADEREDCSTYVGPYSGVVCDGDTVVTCITLEAITCERRRDFG